MPRPQPISGFPEWLPGQRMVEQHFLEVIRHVYELYGYAPLETSAVERVENLEAKGEIDKEVYALARLREDPSERREWELALHFDLTVPLARYVAQHYGQLAFPFKRYQLQKVWRGERPQEGRFREFYQADVDVIAEDSLSVHFDAEMPAIIHEIFERLGIRALIRVNNRKILKGFYASLGVAEGLMTRVLREVDKREKIGSEAVAAALEGLGLERSTVRRCLELAEIRGPAAEALAAAAALRVDHPLFREGLEELRTVIGELAHLPPEHLVVDLGIARGLDYYTGTVYETTLPEHPGLGSICSGGRYDDLASEFTNRRLPGVGISIGVTRLLAHLFASGSLEPRRQAPTEVLVVYHDPGKRKTCNHIARLLRGHRIPTEVYHAPRSLKAQLKYAHRKGIPYVLFPHRWTPEAQRVEVKTMATGEQSEVVLPDWCRQHAGPPLPPARY